MAIASLKAWSGAVAEPFVLLDNSLDPDGHSTLLESPRETVVVERPEQLPAALDRLEAARAAGLTIAGFLAYELGALLEPKLAPTQRRHAIAPLLWMGLFDAPRRLDRGQTDAWLAARDEGAHSIENLGLSLNEAAYLAAFDRVKDYIAAGDVYQINLTLKQRLRLTGGRVSLYRELRRKQRVRHGALVETGDLTLLSLSPELFLEVEKGQARARPMKGTVKRGRTAEEDEALAAWLAADIKSRAHRPSEHRRVPAPLLALRGRQPVWCLLADRT